MGPFILGIDLGGTKVGAAVVDAEHRIVSRARRKTRAWREPEEVFETICETGLDALAEAGIEPTEISALGIGSPGPLDPDRGVIIGSVNLSFKDFPLGSRLSERFHCPVVVDNDVNAGAYGEWRLGAARGAQDVLVVFIGTGIGGGIIVNGELYHGFSKNAGEVGHMVIKAGGPRCRCGSRGCLEALASRVGITRDLRRAIKRGAKSSIAKAVAKKTEAVSSAALKKAYNAEDRLVVKTVDRASRYIGIALGGLVNLLGPEVIVMGGGLVEAFGEKLIEPIDRQMRATAIDYLVKDVRLVRAELGDDAGVMGAALLAQESLARSRVSIESPA